MFRWLWIVGKISHGVVGGYRSILILRLQIRGAGSSPLRFVVECKTVGMEATMGLALWSATGKHERAWSTHLQGSLLCLQLLLQTDKEYFDGISTQPALCIMKKHISLQSSCDSCGGLLNEIHLERSLNHWHKLTLKSKSHYPLIRPSFIFFIPSFQSITLLRLLIPSSCCHPSPNSWVALTLWRTIELNWWLLDTVCCLWDVWYVANPLNLPSDPLPALSVKLAEVSGFR